MEPFVAPTIHEGEKPIDRCVGKVFELWNHSMPLPFMRVRNQLQVPIDKNYFLRFWNFTVRNKKNIFAFKNLYYFVLLSNQIYFVEKFNISYNSLIGKYVLGWEGTSYITSQSSHLNGLIPLWTFLKNFISRKYNRLANMLKTHELITHVLG